MSDNSFRRARNGLVAALCVWGSIAHGANEITERDVRTVAGQEIEIFTLRNARGLEARVMTLGATLVRMAAPDRAGKMADVTLGFDEPEGYIASPYFGSVVGRYGNRIAKGVFTLDGQTFSLATNNGPNHLHGGRRGFDKQNWSGQRLGSSAVRFSYTSADGEEGYPGTLKAAVTYTLTERNELRLDYEAATDKPTILNLTNHTFWNLAGTGDILRHELRLAAARFTVVDRENIPTGELRAVAGTPMDFTKAKFVGRDLADPELAGGYDHNFVLDAGTGELALAAELRDAASGRVMRVLTTEPGVQLYTANRLRDQPGKGGRVFGRHAGLCLETQHFPDSPNHPEFPSTTLRPGETFRSTTVYEFSVAEK